MSKTDKALVFERERLSSTAIGELTAIPHPVYNNTSSSFISVLVLNQPIRWDENTWVQIVFLLHIAKEKSALWEEVFLNLYHFIKDKGGVQFILQNKSYEMFLKEFTKMF